MRLRAGELIRKIHIERRSITYDANRSKVEAWNTYAGFVPAAFRPVSGTDGVIAGEEAAQVRGEFWIRFRSDLKTSDRIRYNDRIFDILDIAEIDRRQGLKIAVIERRGK